MQVDAAAGGAGRLHQAPEHRGGADVGGVGADADAYHGIVPVPVHQGQDGVQLGPDVAVKGKDGAGDVGPDAGLPRGPGDLLPVEVVVGKGGDAVVRQLGAAEAGPPVDVLRKDLAFVGPDLPVKPVVDADVLGQPPEDVHGGVGV